MIDDLGTPEHPLSRMEAAFWEFHLENPIIYELFDKFTRQSIAAGRKHFSHVIVVERIRWATMVETIHKDDFKINNNHRAYYARLWMRNNPSYEGFFRTREVMGGRNGGYADGSGDDPAFDL